MKTASYIAMQIVEVLEAGVCSFEKVPYTFGIVIFHGFAVGTVHAA
jgi:hypothetical protein